MRHARWIAIGALLLAGPAALATGENPARPLAGPPAEPPLPSERIDADLAYIRTALAITPEQTAQWNEVADVLRGMARHRDQRILAMRASVKPAFPPDPIEALERRRVGLAEESRDLADLIAAAKPLFGQLSAEQKKAAGWVLGPLGEPGLTPPPALGPGPGRMQPIGLP